MNDDLLSLQKRKHIDKLLFLYYFYIKIIIWRCGMSLNLMTVFKTSDLHKFGQTANNVISLAFKTNKKNGSKIARAVLDDGTTLIKTVTATGVEVGQVLKLPEINSIAQRNAVIRDLTKNKITQEQIAAMLDVSQATVSNVLRKK